jgi:hypothetical protein
MTPHRAPADALLIEADQPTSASGPAVPQHAGTSSKFHNPQRIQLLGAAAGNSAVCRLVGDFDSDSAPAGRSGDSVTVSDVLTTSIRVEIPYRPGPVPDRVAHGRGHGDHDAEEDGAGEQVDPGAVAAAFAAAIVPVGEPEPGETVVLPDMAVSVGSGGDDQDAVSGAITYSPSVTQAGTVSPFGETKWYTFGVTGARVVRTPSSPSVFVTTFTLTNPITFNVTSPKTSIASENDPAITNTNFPTVASDLTPTTFQGGKPPRTQFWARDLTVVHEQFHCNERKTFGAAGTTQAQAWLSGQSASSVADVQALVAQVPARVIASSVAAAGTVHEKETRAYTAGAQEYRTRADAIRAKGALGPTGGGYP